MGVVVIGQGVAETGGGCVIEVWDNGVGEEEGDGVEFDGEYVVVE